MLMQQLQALLGEKAALRQQLAEQSGRMAGNEQLLHELQVSRQG